MQNSVRVRDYYNNDDNGLWSWYLRNIRLGDFEELTGNQLKYTLLKRFLNSHFYSNATTTDTAIDDNNNTNSVNDIKPTVKKILLVSIPDKVHSDISLLELFLRDYFHLEDLENIQITKLTQSECYNHENHYLLTDKVNNFDDPMFLEFAGSTWQGRPNLHLNNLDSLQLQEQNDDEEEKQREEREEKQYIHKESRDPNEDSSIDNDTDEILITQPITTTTSLSHNNQAYTPDENEQLNQTEKHTGNAYDNSSIVLNFPHLRKHSKDPKQTIINEQQEEPLANNQYYTPPQSELVSINSFGDDDTNSMAYQGHPLHLVLTRQDEESSTQLEEDELGAKNLSNTALGLNNNDNHMDDQSSGLEPSYENSEISIQNSGFDSYSNQLQRFDDDTNEEIKKPVECVRSIDEDDESDYNIIQGTRNMHVGDQNDSDEGDDEEEVHGDDDDDDDDLDDLSSDYSVLSILPSISISDRNEGHFRLVLQSTLIQNPITKEIFTAIRQSNNEPTIAHITDDWLLYDSKFAMDNLQILTLQDLLDSNRTFPKILFYSMVIVNESSPPINDDQHNYNGMTALNSEYLSNKLESLEKTSSEEGKSINRYKYYPTLPKAGITAKNGEMIADVPEQFFPGPPSDDENGKGEDYDDDYDDESLMEQHGPEMYLPTRMQTNVTTAHRSIRTANSIGEWAFNRMNSNTTSNNMNVDDENKDPDYMEDTSNDKYETSRTNDVHINIDEKDLNLNQAKLKNKSDYKSKETNGKHKLI
ncbi:Gis4p NDAI_0C01070 [Naumovozyma dairenensis CBS 421]|uniref:Protein GIS4 n=1 Tax=Naumovozyma dairenensis (strain ATCC 10597 / BCRC 20456 / CBS 421 / NBRC 0211 / NRRL Y-12639) TaxID=1071378 RepID=G0W7K7_NAUDC|nr:hypothetical protein NDAI_0C01070 [Naumovozyma dairenensis CBS 421]CCD23768.1 hypothetical protein NDAI_0C01070 [Naumovozyma dairenensis CBS 421]